MGSSFSARGLNTKAAKKGKRRVLTDRMRRLEKEKDRSPHGM